jgi:hypothetical protein
MLVIALTHNDHGVEVFHFMSKSAFFSSQADFDVFNALDLVSMLKYSFHRF